MLDQDRLQSSNDELEEARKAAFPDLELPDPSTFRQAAGRLLGAIVAMEKSCVEGERTSEEDLSSIIDLEKHIRNNENGVYQSARDKSSFREAVSQASDLATYYKTSGNFLARHENLDECEGAAEGLEEMLAER